MKKNYEYRSKDKICMRFQSFYLIPLTPEIQPGCIVRNCDFVNSKVHKLVYNGSIFPNSFASVKGNQYMNCQSLQRVFAPLNFVWQGY